MYFFLNVVFFNITVKLLVFGADNYILCGWNKYLSKSIYDALDLFVFAEPEIWLNWSDVINTTLTTSRDALPATMADNPMSRVSCVYG